MKGAKLAVAAAGLAAIALGAGSASAADCKTYVKANYLHPICDWNMHQAMMQKMMMDKMHPKKKLMHPKKKK
jgi:hypothetical protein